MTHKPINLSQQKLPDVIVSPSHTMHDTVSRTFSTLQKTFGYELRLRFFSLMTGFVFILCGVRRAATQSSPCLSYNSLLMDLLVTLLFPASPSSP